MKTLYCFALVWCVLCHTAGAGEAVWSAKVKIAERARQKHDKDSFIQLLDLLKDTNTDVSYAAAEALEAREDLSYVDLLLDAIAQVPSDSQWPAFRALGSYKSSAVFIWLTKHLQHEMDQAKNEKYWDERNAFYLAESMAKIAQTVFPMAKLKPPPQWTKSKYTEFLNSAKPIAREAARQQSNPKSK